MLRDPEINGLKEISEKVQKFKRAKRVFSGLS
jgi:hypothetical protein